MRRNALTSSGGWLFSLLGSFTVPFASQVETLSKGKNLLHYKRIYRHVLLDTNTTPLFYRKYMEWMEELQPIDPALAFELSNSNQTWSQSHIYELSMWDFWALAKILFGINFVHRCVFWANMLCKNARKRELHRWRRPNLNSWCVSVHINSTNSC